MSVNLTRPTPVIPVVPAPNLSQRDALMHAFSVAETVVANLADEPTTVNIERYDSGYRVEIYFHHQPELVARFAAQYGITTAADPHYNADSSTYTSADVLVDGVTVRGWSLMRHEERAA
ncbi:hypothetical protein ACGF1Z_31435 [Streptomyces sp. NPDC048018]|uniref:hypothetical protein n=1 Tax=Streptomyces sp. NPDC048018 TaxID=3365499 RepID=UPI0037237067